MSRQSLVARPLLSLPHASAHAPPRLALPPLLLPGDFEDQFSREDLNNALVGSVMV